MKELPPPEHGKVLTDMQNGPMNTVGWIENTHLNSLPDFSLIM